MPLFLPDFLCGCITPQLADGPPPTETTETPPNWELKTGSYAVEGKALGFLVTKGQGEQVEHSFWVATADAGCGDEFTFWESKLKPAGLDDCGCPKFRIAGHPDDGFFVKTDDDTFCELDRTMEEHRCVWKFRDDIKGKFLTTIAAPPRRANLYPTENFAQSVLHKDPQSNEPCSPPTQTIVEACCSIEESLPEEPIERQKMIAKLYTMETPLYHEMNKALRDDDLSAMRYYSAYIKELRDVFKTDHQDQIIEPFVGKVWRGITFPDPDVAVKDFAVGNTFVWSAFTSMSLDRDVAFNFGNIVFEVSCLPPKEAYDGAVAVYAPASVQAFSDFSEEAEILFPPNVQFEVKQIQMPDGRDGSVTSPLVICETVAFDSDEGLKEFRTFKKMLDEALKSGALDNTPAEKRAEVIRKGYKRLFTAFDVNKSGTLSKKEMRGALKKVQGAVAFAGAAFPGIAMPGESKAAIKACVNDMFATSDMDGDGSLTFDELHAALASKHGSVEGLGKALAGMSLQDWTSSKKTLDTVVLAFKSGDLGWSIF